MPQGIKLESTRKKEIDHKNTAMEYFKLLGSGKYKEGLRFFAPDCKTHSPYVSGSMETLTDAMMGSS